MGAELMKGYLAVPAVLLAFVLLSGSAVAECPVTSPTPSPTVAGTSHTGTLSTLVVLLQYGDGPIADWTPAFVSPLYNAPYPGGNSWTGSVADFYSATSWGQLSVTADVVGPFTLSVSSTDRLGCWNISAIASDADAQAVAAGADLSRYTNRAYLMQQSPNCIRPSTGEENGTRAWYQLDSGFCGVSHPSYCQQIIRSLTHEIGHNLGLDHAGVLECSDAAGNRVSLSDSCVLQDYLDPWDTMGRAGELNNIHRAQLGWIPASQVVTVTAGTFTVTSAYNPASLVYRVPDGTGQFIYLENRHYPASPRDQNYDRAGDKGRLILRRATDILAIDPGATNYTQLLESKPAPDPVNAYDAYPWPVGYTLTLPHTGTRITNVSWDGSNNVVSVTP